MLYITRGTHTYHHRYTRGWIYKTSAIMLIETNCHTDYGYNYTNIDLLLPLHSPIDCGYMYSKIGNHEYRKYSDTLVWLQWLHSLSCLTRYTLYKNLATRLSIMHCARKIAVQI